MINLVVSAVEVGEFCVRTSKILQLVGWLLTFFKVAIPVIIIALGMFDFGKAVVSSEDDEIKKQTKRLIYRAIAGIVIFFVPTIILFLFGVIGGYSESEDAAGFSTCRQCVLTPWGDECKSAVSSADTYE